MRDTTASEKGTRDRRRHSGSERTQVGRRGADHGPAKLSESFIAAMVVDRCLYRHRRPDLIAGGASEPPARDPEELAANLDAYVESSPPAPARLSLGQALAHDPLVAGVAGDEPRAGGGSVFLGSGLTTGREQACGLGFEVLRMMLAADCVRRFLGLRDVVHIVADRHAAANGFVNPREIDLLARQAVEDLRTVATALGLPGYSVFRASELQADAAHATFMHQAASVERRYVRCEVADIEWARRELCASVKVGWRMPGSLRAEGRDERLFDIAHEELFGPGLAYVYVPPGYTDDPERPRVSPYALLAQESRPALRGDGRTAQKGIPPRSKTMRRELDRLLARLELHLGPAPSEDIGERLRRVQRCLFARTGGPAHV